MASHVYLISGANRGVGFLLVKAFASRGDVKVYAGARDPVRATELNKLAAESAGKVSVVKLTSADEEDNQLAVEFIKQEAGRLDTVIANAGIASSYGPVAESELADYRNHYEVNVLGPVALYKATKDLLQASSESPKFIVISSAVGCLADQMPRDYAVYGSSKTAINFVVKHIHRESDRLVAFPINPGFLNTETGAWCADAMGNEVTPIEPEVGVQGVVKVIEAATRASHGGRFWDYTGQELQWRAHGFEMLRPSGPSAR